MQQLINLPNSEKQLVLHELYQIANYNRNWFFSKEFENIIVNELQSNISTSVFEVNQTRGKNFLSSKKLKLDRQLHRAELLKLRELRKTIDF